ncbi:hypothetical protein Tco_0445822 [Tanacetum coccineum]
METTPTLWLRSPGVRRQRERVVGFEDAPNREGNRRGRNVEGIRPLEIEASKGQVPITCQSAKENHNIKQREGKSTRAFITRYTDDTLQILDLPSTYKGLIEKAYTWVEAREVATDGILNNRRDDSERSKKFSWDPRYKKVAKTFEQPPRFLGANWSKDKTRYCHFHEDYGHETNQCRELKHQIEEAVKSGQLAHLVKGVKEKKEKTTSTSLEGRKKEEKKPILDKVYVLMISKKNHNVKKRPANHRARYGKSLSHPFRMLA